MCVFETLIALFFFTSDEVTWRPALAVLLIGWAMTRSSRESSPHRRGSASLITHRAVLRTSTHARRPFASTFFRLQTKAEVAAAQAFYRWVAKNESSAHL